MSISRFLEDIGYEVSLVKMAHLKLLLPALTLLTLTRVSTIREDGAYMLLPHRHTIESVRCSGYPRISIGPEELHWIVAAKSNSLFKFSSMTSQLDVYRIHRVVCFRSRLVLPGLA